MEIVKSGIVTIVGRPNAGKSTLINQLAGEKIAIVSEKPQTTRNRISAVVNDGDTQIVFLDTPGYHKPRSRLDQYMSDVVENSVTDVDAVVLVVEPVARIGKPEENLISQLETGEIPVVLLINKIDTVPKEELLKVIQCYSQRMNFDSIIPVSALLGDGMKELLEELKKWIPEGPRLFPEGMITDQPEKQIVAELIREKMLKLLDSEVPHGIAVDIEQMIERDDEVIDISAVIYCEKSSHKGIIIGKNGAMLRQIGTLARQDLEDFFGTRVYLQTWVKVKENWRDRPGLLHTFGFEM